MTEASSENKNLVSVFTTWDNIEAGFVQSLLESSEIECITNNVYLASMALVGTSLSPITIMVQSKDKEKANEIIQQYYEDSKQE